MSNGSGFYPRVNSDVRRVGAVGNAGGVLLTETVRRVGLDDALSAALAGWRKPFAVHDPGKVVTDLAVALALGGDALADVAVLRSEPSLYGQVASDPTVSRAIAALAADADGALKAINAARAVARERAWTLAGEHAPDRGADARSPLVIDLDATLVTAHSEKENARPTFKRGFGFHPLCAFVDHGPAGTGEPLAILLRPGNAGSNTADDHITVIKQALDQLLGHRAGRSRASKRILVRTDGAGSTHKLLEWLAKQRLSYSVGFVLPAGTPDLLRNVPTPEPSSASTTSTGTGSPRSRPTPAPAASTTSCPTSSCATAAAPAARTASASPRTPGSGTCPCTASTRTASGAPS